MNLFEEVLFVVLLHIPERLVLGDFLINESHALLELGLVHLHRFAGRQHLYAVGEFEFLV